MFAVQMYILHKRLLSV